MPRQQSKATAANTNRPADIIPYERAVNEGKEIVLEIEAAERGQLRLGELADKVEPKYGDRTQAKLATEIGVAKCTLDRYRTVYRAWAGNLAPGPNLVPQYAVLRELATHPEREQIIRQNPNLTKREARDKMRDHKRASGEKQKQDQEEDWLKHSRKWFEDLVVLANEVSSAAGVVDECTPEQLDTLLQAVDPGSLMYVRRGGRRLFKLANHLAELLGEEAEPFAPEPIARDRRAEAEATGQVVAN
jgi:hypothetical protein